MPLDIAALFAGNPLLFAGCVFLLSLLIGSFLNVVIYRMPVMLEREWRAQAASLTGSEVPVPEPRRFNLMVPASACPACQAPIRAWQNIPVLSWLVLRGRCAACKAPISARYPIVELTTGLLSAWVALRFGYTPSAACALLVTWSLIALTVIDLDHQLLPDNITLPLMWAGLLAAVIFGGSPDRTLPVGPVTAILGAAAGYLSLWLVFHVFRLLTGKEGMGYGDFKLFAALGAWLGWKALPLIILLSAGTGAVVGIALILFRGRDRAQPMPFGPYLAAAGGLAMMYGDALISSYLRISGLSR